MKRKLEAGVVLCLLLVASIALSVAPAASARATRISITGTEAMVASTPVVYEVTGGVAHIELDNVFYESATPSNPLMDGYNHTHLVAIATLVDGVPTDAVMHGTWHLDAAAGEWEGTFAGTINMLDLTYKCIIVGHGISGSVTGMTMSAWDVKTDPGVIGVVGRIDGWILAPHGM